MTRDSYAIAWAMRHVPVDPAGKVPLCRPPVEHLVTIIREHFRGGSLLRQPEPAGGIAGFLREDPLGSELRRQIPRRGAGSSALARPRQATEFVIVAE